MCAMHTVQCKGFQAVLLGKFQFSKNLRWIQEYSDCVGEVSAVLIFLTCGRLPKSESSVVFFGTKQAK